MSSQISEERSSALMTRYKEFVKDMGNTDKVPVRVFDPLTLKQNEELQLIREISAYLQKKKDEDIAKQAQTETEETDEKEEETKEESEEQKS